MTHHHDTLTYSIYQQHIKPLSRERRMYLLAMIAHDLAETMAPDQTETMAPDQPERTIMELHGLGKEYWQEIDAQEYVNTVREEWDHRV